MAQLINIYRHFYKATEKIVKIYAPTVNLNHLKLKDTASPEEIYNNVNELSKYYSKPEFTYLLKKNN